MKNKIITKGSMPTHEEQYAEGSPAYIDLEYPEEKKLWGELLNIKPTKIICKPKDEALVRRILNAND